MKTPSSLFRSVAAAALLLFGLSACGPMTIGRQSNVALTSDGERLHLQDNLTAEDYIALSNRVIDKMINSAVVRKWGDRNKKPLLVVAVPENLTHDADIITDDLQDEIIARILDAGLARVIDESSISARYDYILKTTITSTTQRGDYGSRLTYYTCKLQLFSLRGERLGQWHDKIGMAKTRRGLF